jgi:hypothetical protein
MRSTKCRKTGYASYVPSLEVSVNAVWRHDGVVPLAAADAKISLHHFVVVVKPNSRLTTRPVSVSPGLMPIARLVVPESRYAGVPRMITAALDE